MGHEADDGFQFPCASAEPGDLLQQGFGGPVHVYRVAVGLPQPLIRHHAQALDILGLVVDLHAGDRDAFHGGGGAGQLGGVFLEITDHPGEMVRGSAQGGRGALEILRDLPDPQGGLFHILEHGAQILRDLVGRLAHVVRELADFLGYDSEALAHFARVGGFDGGVQGQQLRLPRYAFDQLDHIADALRPLGKLGHEFRELRQPLVGGGHALVRLEQLEVGAPGGLEVFLGGAVDVAGHPGDITDGLSDFLAGPGDAL